MKWMGLGALAVVGLAGCAISSELEDTRPMSFTNDMTVQTIARAVCTRGEKPFKIRVSPDGTGTGRLIPPKPPKGKQAPLGEKFPVSLKAFDRKTVLLVVEPGIVTQDPVSEKMSPVLKNGRVVLRGESFDCTDVNVRPLDT